MVVVLSNGNGNVTGFQWRVKDRLGLFGRGIRPRQCHEIGTVTELFRQKKMVVGQELKEGPTSVLERT